MTMRNTVMPASNSTVLMRFSIGLAPNLKALPTKAGKIIRF
jgi:hypothetical protein